MEEFARTRALIGEEKLNMLRNSRVIVFGLGGVGSYTAEMLARSGVGTIAVVDSDEVSLSNINRQLCALHSTVGNAKTAVIAERIHDINPLCNVIEYNLFYLPESADEIALEKYDYIADAIDNVSAKLELVGRAYRLGIPIISCMGTGNKLDPGQLRVSDIYKTEGCPLCRAMRSALRKKEIPSLKTVWSPETPIRPAEEIEGSAGSHPPASMAFVPASAGILMAREIVCDITGREEK